jgi:hypothetical protein
MNDRVFQALLPAVRRLVRRPLPVLLVSLALTAAGVWATLQLRVDNDFSKLIPPEYPSVQALEQLRANVGGESEAAVIIESPSFEANKRFAEALIPRALALTGNGRNEPYFTSVDYWRDVSFLQDNLLYFATEAELDSLERYLDDRIEQARLEANPFYFELEDEEPAADSLLQTLQESYDELVGKEYPISADSAVLVLRLYPSGVQSDLDFIDDAYIDLQALVDAMEPAGYHPEMEVVLAGRLLRTLIEIQTITDDVKSSFGSGVLLLLAIVVGYFAFRNYRIRAGTGFSWHLLFSELARTPITALLLGTPLLLSEAWTFGVAYLAYGTLNVMTSTLGLVLFGLGIDFGIHFYNRYTEERGAGRSVEVSIEATFMTTGKAIAGVATTTAAAFYILMLADFRGFSEFGFIAGTGILFGLFAMLVLLPALLAFAERTGLLRLEAEPGSTSLSHANGRPVRRRIGYRFALVGFAAATLGAIVLAPRVAFEYDFGALEPVYERYIALQRRARDVYTTMGHRNAAYLLVDHPFDAIEVATILRERAARDTLTPTIREVETLQDRFPMTPADQQAKLERIACIRDQLADPFLTSSDSEYLDLLRRGAGTTAPLGIDQIPDFIRRPFTSKHGELGTLVIVYPEGSLADGRRSMQFADDVGIVETASGRVYHAGSTSIVASDMLRLMQEESPTMIGLTLLFIVVFKVVILRRRRWILLALTPLAASFFWMFGTMVLFDLRLTFYNLVVLPTVLGIGDDSGIHIVHRYIEEGPGSIRRVMRAAGEPIAMSALTTIVGFGGLVFSMHPGMRSLGLLAVLGIGMTLLAALGLLPALLAWHEGESSE